MTLKATSPDPASNPPRIADALREGTAPLLIRRKGAKGELPVSPIEKVEILVILTQDSDEEVRTQARATLETWPAEPLGDALRDSSCPPAVLEFAVHHLVERREELLQALLENSALRPEWQDLILSRMGARPAAARGSLRTLRESSRQKPQPARAHAKQLF